MLDAEYKLFRMLERCYDYILDDEEIAFEKGEVYFLAFGDFGNGGWPMIYVEEYDMWIDFCMIEDGTTDLGDESEKIAEEISKENFTEEQWVDYVLLVLYDSMVVRDMPLGAIKDVSEYIQKHNIPCRPSKIAECIADKM